MKKHVFVIIATLVTVVAASQDRSDRHSSRPDSISTHKALLDDQSRLLPWMAPPSNAYDHFLRQRWNFIKTSVPKSPGPAPRSDYPQYYFYCAYKLNSGTLEPDTWMNDVGEKVPNWFESGRLYYAYTGDTTVMNIVRKLAEYALDHGTSPSSFAWPDFPYTTTNAGDTIFRGFTTADRFELHEVQVDHAGEIGLTYYRLYLFTGEEKFRTAAIKIANTLAANARKGSATQSVWPYRVVLNSGKITCDYGANWFGCITLLDLLIDAKLGNTNAYASALQKARRFVLDFPMKTGYWTDGHTDANITPPTYRSNMSASNAKLHIFDDAGFHPKWKNAMPDLIAWTEKYFITRGAPGEPGNQWGANIVGEQDSFLFKMDYQTARYAAECARWYAVSGDKSYKEKAYRSLNWVTYCSDSAGLAYESPLSPINSWWSDCYGEGPRMFYHVFAAIPEWAPARENHILYSKGILKDVSYLPEKIQYDAVEDAHGIEYIRLNFKPAAITLGTETLSLQPRDNLEGYTLKDLGNGDFAVKINRKKRGVVTIR